MLNLIMHQSFVTQAPGHGKDLTGIFPLHCHRSGGGNTWALCCIGKEGSVVFKLANYGNKTAVILPTNCPCTVWVGRVAGVCWVKLKDKIPIYTLWLRVGGYKRLIHVH